MQEFDWKKIAADAFDVSEPTEQEINAAKCCFMGITYGGKKKNLLTGLKTQFGLSKQRCEEVLDYCQGFHDTLAKDYVFGQTDSRPQQTEDRCCRPAPVSEPVYLDIENRGGPAMAGSDFLVGFKSQSKRLIISPKDNGNKIVLEGVETFMPEGPTLGVVFKDGRRRNYPLCHIWWYGPDTPNTEPRTKPL